MARPKVSNLHNKFHSAVSSSSHFRAQGNREGKGGNRRSSSDYGPSDREKYNINLQEAQQQLHTSPDQLVRKAAYYQTRSDRFTDSSQSGPAVAELDQEAQRPRVSKTDTTLIARASRESTWNRAKGIYTPRSVAGEKARIKSPGDFIGDEMAKSHRQWLEGSLQDPTSEFNKGLDLTKEKSGKYTPAQRRRLAIYTNSLQHGETHQQALQRVRNSRTKQGVGRPVASARDVRATQAREALQKPRHAGRETKFKSVAPTANEFRRGLDAQARPKLDDLKRRFPARPESELIQIQQAGTEFVAQELLANQKWAHETRRANLLAGKNQTKKENPDKVTIFTTNIGHPAVSVPSDSLVGQYIIRKRKSILGNYGVPSSQLKGQFPDAVRDAHIVDVATGASIAAQGRQGVFNTTGYRVGKKASPGYGKPRPLGSHILYDTSTGRPLYDSQGNIRYSEGATRQFDWTTPDVGFRILIG